ILADHASQHRLEAADDLVDVEDARSGRLVAAEREQLPRDLCSALGGGEDLADVAAGRRRAGGSQGGPRQAADPGAPRGALARRATASRRSAWRSRSSASLRAEMSSACPSR